MNIARDTDQKENITVKLKSRPLRGSWIWSNLDTQFNLMPQEVGAQDFHFSLQAQKVGAFALAFDRFGPPNQSLLKGLL